MRELNKFRIFFLRHGKKLGKKSNNWVNETILRYQKFSINDSGYQIDLVQRKEISLYKKMFLSILHNVLKVEIYQDVIELKGMTFDHDFCYSLSFSSSLFFSKGREKGKRITKAVVKRHAFLLYLVCLLEKGGYKSATYLNKSSYLFMIYDVMPQKYIKFWSGLNLRRNKD